jgi:hypothetical protein
LHRSLKLGIDNCFHPLIEQLTRLEVEGLEIATEDGPIRIYFVLTLVRGDNAGLHNLLGFVESFVANHCCRMCRVHRDVMRHMTVLDEVLLRTVENYREDVAVNDVSVTGVNEECVFNDIPSYHCVINQYCDLMHDLPEGVFKYCMCNIIHYLVNERNYFDFDTLQERVKNFDYGSAEVGNRPPAHKLTPDRVANDSLNFSASEMICFTRYFGEMLGDLVPEEDVVWAFYLHMRDLMDILFAPKFVIGSEVYLQHMVEFFLQSYLNLFHTHLTIKFHLLLHYPFLLSLLGPLINLWCMRDEAKHRESRIMAHSTNSRVRLEYTLLFRHQLKLSSRFLAQRGLFIDFDYGMGYTMPLNYFGLLGNNAVEQLPELADEQLISVSWVRKQHTMYYLNMVLIVGEEEMQPVFGKIREIYVRDDNSDVVFIVQLYNLHGFVRHYHAYHVSEGYRLRAVTHEGLHYFLPLHVRNSAGGRKLITCKYL